MRHFTTRIRPSRVTNFAFLAFAIMPGHFPLYSIHRGSASDNGGDGRHKSLLEATTKFKAAVDTLSGESPELLEQYRAWSAAVDNCFGSRSAHGDVAQPDENAVVSRILPTQTAQWCAANTKYIKTSNNCDLSLKFKDTLLFCGIYF
eukprot:SAG31_NODE_16965_length_688_cov_2.015280_1_plen_146_part_10